jgi:acetoin utilization deacetylase AcuC-like enzyme
MTIALISHPDCALHEMGPGHPESPQRLSAIEDHLLASGLELAIRRFRAPLATREQLAQVHDEAYIDAIFAAAPKEGLVWLDTDTAMNPHSLNAAMRAAGSVVKAVDLVMGGEVSSAFCSVRPPGHHAERARAMGFCIFNNIAVGAAHALARYDLQRVAIVDFDVHHGNGTEQMFAGNPKILFCSSFQHPYYPHSDPTSHDHNIVKVPLPGGTSSGDFRRAIETNWCPPLHEFAPQLLMISAGFDGHREDDMAQLLLSDQDYGWVTRQVKMIADQYAGGRIVSTLEGGYALAALGRSVGAHLDALLGGAANDRSR